MSGVATLRVNNKERISTAGKPPTEVRAGEYVIETDEVVVRTQREDSDGLTRLCPSHTQQKGIKKAPPERCLGERGGVAALKRTKITKP